MHENYTPIVLAHLIADFVTQTTYINERKRHFKYPLYSKALLYHSIHHLAFMFIGYSRNGTGFTYQLSC